MEDQSNNKEGKMGNNTIIMKVRQMLQCGTGSTKESDQCDVNSSNEESIGIKGIYDELWRGRDFELSHFWQRSIFLSAFLSGCYIAYCGILQKILSSECSCFVRYNILAIVVAMIGCMMSCLWIAMAKGSKFWYEEWENAIWNFVDCYLRKESDWAGFHFREKLGKIKPRYKKPCAFLFSTRAGKYSPSRINIGIGQLSLIFFFLALLSHITLNFKDCDIVRKLMLLIESHLGSILIVGPILIGIVFLAYLHWFFRSKD